MILAASVVRDFIIAIALTAVVTLTIGAFTRETFPPSGVVLYHLHAGDCRAAKVTHCRAAFLFEARR